MTKGWKTITFAVALSLLGACVTTPKTPAEQLAAVELTFTGVVEQLVEARNVGIVEDDALWACMQLTARTIDTGLDAARRYLSRGQSIAIVVGTIQAQIKALKRLGTSGVDTCAGRYGRPTDHPIGQQI